MAKKTGAGDKPQTFDESNGRYMKDAKRAEVERIYDTVGSITPTSIQSKPEQAYGFVGKDRKNTAHHKNHAKEMGFNNQDEYEREACRFFNSNEGELYYSERRDRFYRYDEKKGRLVTSSNGVIHTFMPITKKKMGDKIKEDKLWKILR